MLLKEIVEMFQRQAGGGVFDTDTRYDIGFSEDTIHKARATVMFNYYQKYKKINPIWLQPFIGTYDADLQESKRFVKFVCPPTVTLDDFIDGFIYVGNLDGTVEYTKNPDRASLLNSQSHRYISRGLSNPTFIYFNGCIEIYNNPNIKELKVDGIFLDPTKVSSYNKEYDPYPVDDSLIPLMQDLIYNSESKIELGQGVKVKNQFETK